MANEKRKLQVFVSSTYTDLQVERQIAVSAILKAGHIPAGMELFSAGDKSQLDVIKKWIDESDVYMLILGTRYGSIENDTGLSYTELEYDYAVATGKPFFALVMSDEATDEKLKESGSKYLEKANPAKLSTFREKVLAKMCSIYSNRNDIKAYIYESLMEFMGRDDLIGWVSGSKVIDNSYLQEQIADLTAQNERLKVDLSDARLRNSIDGSQQVEQEDFSKLEAILRNCSMEMPESISKHGVSFNTNAFKLYGLNRSLYISGVTVTNMSSERVRWFEKNLYGILVTHRILRVDYRANGSRFYSMTEKGLDFGAWLDKRNLNLDEA